MFKEKINYLDNILIDTLKVPFWNFICDFLKNIFNVFIEIKNVYTVIKIE